MEVGQQNNGIAFIIQARMQSTRLPGKILLPLPLWADKPMLLWIVEALKSSSFPSKIFVATSRNSENDVLEHFCDTNKITCFRGDEDNVLGRFVQILKHKEFQTVVRLTADNPIVDIDLLDQTISYHQQQKNQYTNTEALPLGMNFEVIETDALLALENMELSMEDKEHVTLFIRNSTTYQKGIYQPTIDPKLKNLRLTVDYASDLLAISSLLGFSNRYRDLKGLELVKRIHREYPFLFEANSSNIQKKQFSKIKSELKFAVKVLKDFDLHRSAAILEQHEEKNSI